MSCPVCPPKGKCPACLTENVARRGRPKLKKEDKRQKLNLRVHPQFPAWLGKKAFDADMSMGRYVEQQLGFTPTKK
jgi:predicted HicB family RNase H-like nuclease